MLPKGGLILGNAAEKSLIIFLNVCLATNISKIQAKVSCLMQLWTIFVAQRYSHWLVDLLRAIKYCYDWYMILFEKEWIPRSIVRNLGCKLKLANNTIMGYPHRK